MRARAFALVLLSAALLLLSCGRKPVQGLQYSFSTDVEAEGIEDPDALRGVKGKAYTDGTFTRLEIEKGDGKLFKDGTVFLTDDGGESVTVLTLHNKTYYTYESEEYEKSLSAASIPKFLANFELLNVRVFVEDMGSDRKLQGYPTRRYVLNMRFDVRVSAGGRTQTAHTVMKSRVWTTEEIDEKYYQFLASRQVRSGLKEIDEKVEKVSKEITGFPLRQITDTELRIGDEGRAMRSTTRMYGIEKKELAAELFEVPDGFEKVDPPEPEALVLR